MLREKVVNCLSLCVGYLYFFCCFFFVSCFFSQFWGGDFYKCMYFSALFIFLVTSFYFPGIVLPQILQPCLLDAWFLSLAPLSSDITLLPWVKLKKPKLLLKVQLREFLCLLKIKPLTPPVNMTFCTDNIKNRRPTCLYLTLLSPTTP